MKKLILLSAVLSLALSIGVGCHKTLEQGGAYNPSITNASGGVTSTADMALFTADSVFWAAYSTIDAVFLLERNNRELFWKISPDIKHSLDKIRPTATEVKNGYLKARAAYIANPTTGNLATVNDWLAKLQQLVTAVQAALPATSTTGGN